MKSASEFSSSEPAQGTNHQLTKNSANYVAEEHQAVKLINLGRLQEAELIYKELISQGNTNHIIYGNLAAIYGMQGRFKDMINLLNKTLELKPDYPDAHNNLGVALKEQGDLDNAIASYNKALYLKPNFPDAHYNLGNALQEQGDLNAAADSFNKALELKPDYPQAHNNLGITLQKQGDLGSAVSCYTKALQIKPYYPEAHYNLGNALKEQGDLISAIHSYKKAIELKPNYPKAHLNMGNALREKGDLNAAIASYNRALELKPDYAEAHWNSSLTLLLGSNYRNGWEKYEYRVKTEQTTCKPHAYPKCPQWDGKRLSPNDQLLMVSEQGLGDTLQFMRYIIPLRDQGVAVALCAQTKLHSLIQASGMDPSPLTPEQASQVSNGQWIPILSVPRHLEVSPENPIITEPYINSTDGLIAKWKDILSAEKHKIIAINWQGDPETEKLELKGRSFPLETFAPIAHIKNASLLSLQKGFGSEQLETCSFKDSFVSCQDQVNDTWDYLETAAIIANCDLVITSDTSVAHLAGGMGKTTWLLLKKVPEWRWGLEGDATFWYPSMRLFRQEVQGDWNEVMERVAEELQKLFGYTSTITQSVSTPAPES